MEMEGIETNGASNGTTSTTKPSLNPSPPIPYTHDLGNLCIYDYNLLPSSSPSAAEIHALSRNCAQSLINTLLSTCIITTTSKDGTLIKLPPPSTPLPREKPLPAEKAETKWEKFARKKGIGKGRRDDGKGGKMVYDEEKGEWVPKWGYKGRNKEGDNQWIVEVDEKKEKALKEGETVRGVGRRERVENARRNERKMRANERRARKDGA